MLTMFREGGTSMFAILALGGVTLLTALLFALRPAAVHERFLAWMTVSTLAAILCGIAFDIATVFHAVGGEEMPMELRVRITMQGISESMAPAIIGFAMLSMIALMTAVGKRRLDARRAA